MKRTLQSKLDPAAAALWDINCYGISSVDVSFETLRISEPIGAPEYLYNLHKLVIEVIYDSDFDSGDINFASGAVLLRPRSRISRFFSRIRKKLR